MMRASGFGWGAASLRRGGNPPAPAFPRRGKRERGVPIPSCRLFSSRRHTPLSLSRHRKAPVAFLSILLAQKPVGLLHRGDLRNSCVNRPCQVR